MHNLRLALVAAVLASACSHAQPPPPPPAPQAQPAPPPPAPKPPEPAPAAQEVAQPVTPPQPQPPTAVYFEFDKFTLQPAGREALSALQAKLPENARIRIEGNCDERGTNEYNIALGQRRANAAKKYLEHLGVAADRIHTVSFGKEHPKDPGHDEAAWRENRRDDVFVETP